METENTPEVEETIEASTEPDATEDLVETEEEAPLEVTAEPEEKLILGKYKDQAELEKAYLNAQSQLTKVTQAQNDPTYVYELARKAGLTDAEAQQEAENVDINQLVDQRLQVAKDYDKALSILPELGKDATLETWARGLVDGGMTHEQAAKTIKAKLSNATAEARVEGSKAAQAEISEKEAAQTAPTVGNVDPEASELETLRNQSKSLNRVEQEDAMTKLILKNLQRIETEY